MARTKFVPKGVVISREAAAVATSIFFRRHAQDLGFDAADLVSGGILSVPKTLSSQPICTLEDRIHLLFAEARWDPDCQDAYAALKPALQLATLWLTQAPATRFFHTLCLGERTRFSYAGNYWVEKGKDPDPVHPWIREQSPWIDDGENQAQQILLNLSDRIRFRFQGMELFASHRTDIDPWPHMVTLNDDLLAVARDIQAGRQADANAILRFNYHLAVIITHEIAHAFETCVTGLSDADQETFICKSGD